MNMWCKKLHPIINTVYLFFNCQNFNSKNVKTRKKTVNLTENNENVV